MSNNKQSSVEMIEEFLLSHCNPTICNVEWSDFKLMLEQAKAMHHKEVVDFVEDWYCNGHLLGGGVDVVATIEEHYNEIFGGNDEQQ